MYAYSQNPRSNYFFWQSQGGSSAILIEIKWYFQPDNDLNYIYIYISDSYSDWYQPVEEWDTPVVHLNTIVTDLLNLKNPQPNADVGSLCTVMMTVTPFKSLNWAKIPCDYPIFRSGLICKMPTIKISIGKCILSGLIQLMYLYICDRIWFDLSNHIWVILCWLIFWWYQFLFIYFYTEEHCNSSQFRIIIKIQIYCWRHKVCSKSSCLNT